MLTQEGLPGRVCRKRPLLGPIHCRGRHLWAAALLNWTLSTWTCIVFSDESKINLIGSDGRDWCHRGPHKAFRPDLVNPTEKYGGASVMVWGCVTWMGVGRLHRIEGKMNAQMYCEILEEDLLGSLDDQFLGPGDIIFQQDNDLKHKSRLAAQWFSQNHIALLPWPLKSPDMNIIEHLWTTLKHCICARAVPPTNAEQLWVAAQEEWDNISLHKVRNLYRSLPRRVAALKAARGWYTKY